MGPGAGYEGRGPDNPNTHKHSTFKIKLENFRITCIKITWLFVCCTLQCFFKQKWKGQWFYHYFYFYIATLRCLGYPAPIPQPSYLALGPQKNFNHLNFLLFKVQSLCSCAHYFQWFTGYVDFTHVICTCFKETVLSFNVHLSYFADFILCPTGKFNN